MRKIIPLVNVMLLVTVVICTDSHAVTPVMKGKSQEGGFGAPARVFGIDRPFWTPNRIGLYVTNDGQLVSHIPTSNAGLEWPFGSQRHLVFASGLWLAGIKNGEVVTAASNFETEFQPGIVTGHAPGVAGTPADPLNDRFKVYIIAQSDLATPGPATGG